MASRLIRAFEGVQNVSLMLTNDERLFVIAALRAYHEGSVLEDVAEKVWAWRDRIGGFEAQELCKEIRAMRGTQPEDGTNGA
jgi:hypothetical protein